MITFPELSGPGTTYAPREETGDQAQYLAEQPAETEDNNGTGNAGSETEKERLNLFVEPSPAPTCRLRLQNPFRIKL
jgi:hypothetical protein